MNFALEKNTGKKVRAVEGKSYRSYKCPQCLGALTYVDPTTQVAHFRHLPHAAKKDCPFYHVAAGHDISKVFQSQAFRQRQPKLFIRLSNLKTQVKWELLLLVPHIHEFKEFAINQSANRGWIPMESVKDCGKECPVYPSREAYKLALRRANMAPEIEPVDGLGPISVFHLREDLGARVEKSESLLIGEYYVAVFDEKLGITFPTNLKYRTLNPNETWKAVIFEVSESIQSWCNDFLGASLRSCAPVAAVLWPAEAKQTNDGVWNIPRREKLVIAIQSATLTSCSAYFVHENGEAPEVIKLLNSLSFVQSAPLDDGYHELRPDVDELPSIGMLVKNKTQSALGEAITFEFKGENGTNLENLWSVGLSKVLSLVASKKTQLLRINIPSCVPVTFTSYLGKKSLSLIFPGKDQKKDAEALTTAITECLSAKGRSFQLNAGGFGFIRYPTLEAPLKKAQCRSSARAKWLELASPPVKLHGIFERSENQVELRAHIRQTK